MRGWRAHWRAKCTAGICGRRGVGICGRGGGMCGRGRHAPQSGVLALVSSVPVSPWCTEYVRRFSMRPVSLDPCRGNRCVDHQGEQKGVDERVVVGESVA